MSTIENKSGNATAETETTTEDALDLIAAMAAMPLLELDRTSFEDKTKIDSTKRASEFFDGLESVAGSWLDSHRKNSDATYQAALWILRLQSQTLDASGHPVWSGRKAINAWRVVYLDRVPAMYDRLGFSEEERGDFDTAVRKAQSRHAIQKVAVVEYVVERTNLLGTKEIVLDAKTKSTITIADALKIMTGSDAKARKALYGVKWPTDLIKAVRPHVERQTVGGNGSHKSDRQAGFEGQWTYFGPNTDTTTSNSGGSDSGGNTGQETYKSATDKLKLWPTSEHWNPLGSVDQLHEVLTSYSAKFEAGKRVKAKADVIERLRAISIHAATLADMMEEQGKSDKPTPADVAKLHYSAES